MMVTCYKCGSVIPVDTHSETRPILHKIHRLEDQMAGARTRQRQTIVQKISTLRTVYRQMNHALTELNKAKLETPILYTDLREYVVQRELMTVDELNQLTEKSRERAALVQQERMKEIERLMKAVRRDGVTDEV